MTLEFIKAHAYGNDFLFIDEGTVDGEYRSVARAACDRHLGVGGDGLILYRRTASGAVMKLFNADGSHAEVSGNGVRCLAAIIAEAPVKTLREGPFDDITIETDGGIKRLALLETDHPQYTFRAFMGNPHGLREESIEIAGEKIATVVLSVGNPQCIVLTPSLDAARFQWLGPRLATHSLFPHGTNVEFVEVVQPDRLRILIWERGVGQTASSGTGACAAAVAAAIHGGAHRSVDVVSRGGSQHVDWTDNGLYLTGLAEITVRGRWTYVPDARD